MKVLGKHIKRLVNYAEAVDANLAEAWQKRRYPDHFLRKLSDSDGEQAETQHWLDTALACKYLSQKDHARLMSQYRQIGRMLGKMITNPAPFCNRQAGEK